MQLDFECMLFQKHPQRLHHWHKALKEEAQIVQILCSDFCLGKRYSRILKL